MSVALKRVPAGEDAGALIRRYQQRIRADLLDKAATIETKKKRRQIRIAAPGKLNLRAATGGLVESVAEIASTAFMALRNPPGLVRPGLVLPLVAAGTAAAMVLSYAETPWLGLSVLALLVAFNVIQPFRWAGLALTTLVGIGQMVAAGSESTALGPGIIAAFGYIATGVAADRYGLACRGEGVRRRQQEQMIADLQPVDEDAGVLKWRHASFLFDRELARAHRYDHPLALLRIVVDEWPAVKRELGPERTAELIGEVGAALVKSSRIVDVVAYHGEARFDLMLPDTPDLGALVVARRVSEFRSSIGGVRLRVGIVPLTGKGGNIDDLMYQADVAVSMAEQLGRPYAVYGIGTNFASP